MVETLEVIHVGTGGRGEMHHSKVTFLYLLKRFGHTGFVMGPQLCLFLYSANNCISND